MKMQLKVSYNSCDSNGLELYFYTCYKMLLVIRKLQLRTEVLECVRVILEKLEILLNIQKYFVIK